MYGNTKIALFMNLHNGLTIIRRSYKYLILFAVLVVMNVSFAHAAPLTYSVDTTLALSSPAINFIVMGGSVADTVAVNSGNVVVTVSSSTGGSFTLTSTSRDLSVSGSGAISAQTCDAISQTARVIISQASSSATYTIAPAAAQCNGATGVIVGVGGAPAPAPVTTPVLTQASTSSPVSVPSVPLATVSLEDQLTQLKGLLQSLIVKAQQQGIVATTFERNLSYHSRGADVFALQIFLIQQNVGPQAQRLAETGASGLFGPLTTKALAEYQKNAGITPASGYFGPKTRAAISAHSAQ